MVSTTKSPVVPCGVPGCQLPLGKKAIRDHGQNCDVCVTKAKLREQAVEQQGEHVPYKEKRIRDTTVRDLGAPHATSWYANTVGTHTTTIQTTSKNHR